MKKRIITFAFILFVAGISVLAYFMLKPCKEHTDKDGDGYCDRCKEHFNIVAVYYHEYGAKGDGVTNDYAAIKKAHEVANEHGVPVYGDFRKTYLISSTMDQTGNYSTIPIKTDVDWKGCKFIFDDTNIGYKTSENRERLTNIFRIENDYEIQTFNSSSEIVQKLNENPITTKTTWLNINLDYPAMLILYNSDVKHFIRSGGSANTGDDQQEIVLVDKYGNIDPSTPLMFDYDKITSIQIIRTDVKPITVQNATIESKASKINMIDLYLEEGNYKTVTRGISVSRSNCTIKNIYHEITGEIPKFAIVDENSNIVHGYTYDAETGKIKDGSGSEVKNEKLKPFFGHSFRGILQINNCNNILVEGVTFQSRVTYVASYDLNVKLANNVTLKNCDQNNFYYEDENGKLLPNIDNKCWGVSASNYCKNYTFDNCRLSRFDAHCGVYNAKIIDSEVARISIIGAGELLIENSQIHYNSKYGIIVLRDDYGATFNGTIMMKNCEVVLYNDIVPSGIIQARSINHDYGYTTYFPNILIDNLKFKNKKYNENDEDQPLNFSAINLVRPNSGGFRSFEDENLHIPGATLEDDSININPYIPPSKIELANNDNGYNIVLYNFPFFASTEIVGNIQRVSID